MKVILLENIQKLGSIGQIIEVKRGFGRNYLISNKPVYFNLNIWTGKGTSVLKLLKTFEKVNKVKVPYCFCERRKGDVPFLVAENSLLRSRFNIFPKRDIEIMCKDAWRWKLLNPAGY